MGVSVVGQRISIQQIRYAVATALVFLGLFFYLYGPPLTHMMQAAAHDKCNELTGDTFRNYRLEWRTATIGSVDRPQWVCHDLTEPGHPRTSLGWWVGL